MLTIAKLHTRLLLYMDISDTDINVGNVTIKSVWSILLFSS